MADETSRLSIESSAPARPYDAQAEAKRLLRTVRAGSLATLRSDGAPFASLVSVATAPDGRPLLLLSRLAGHTGQQAADPRCSLLLAQGGKGDPLAHPRLSVHGRAARVEAADEVAATRARFLARHPKASLYVDFPDFAFWRIDVDGASLNGGFARAADFERTALLTGLDGCEPLVAAEAGAVAHMNADHRDALRLYATALARMPDGGWLASGIDPEGIDLQDGDRTARVPFPSPVTSPSGLRQVLKALADQARVTDIPVEA